MVPFLKMGDTFASFHTSGSSPLSNDYWKISCRMGESSSCNVCRMICFNLSGPAALCGFKPRRKPGSVAQSVGHLTRKSGVLPIPGLATYFRFSFRFFKKGSCQLLAKVCAGSTG